VVHAITDGRDVPPKSGAALGVPKRGNLPPGVRIGTVIGRYYAMDRDNRWERVAAPMRHGARAGPAAPDAHRVIEAYAVARPTNSSSPR
jgi:2,3-bisphosphoglycerate-independent phosphoglycerate mutase